VQDATLVPPLLLPLLPLPILLPSELVPVMAQPTTARTSSAAAASVPMPRATLGCGRRSGYSRWSRVAIVPRAVSSLGTFSVGRLPVS